MAQVDHRVHTLEVVRVPGAVGVDEIDGLDALDPIAVAVSVPYVQEHHLVLLAQRRQHLAGNVAGRAGQQYPVWHVGPPYWLFAPCTAWSTMSTPTISLHAARNC